MAAIEKNLFTWQDVEAAAIWFAQFPRPTSPEHIPRRRALFESSRPAASHSPRWRFVRPTPLPRTILDNALPKPDFP